MAGARERTLAPPGGGSDHEPAIWDGRLAFLRHNPSDGSRRPENLYAWDIGSHKLQSLTLPTSRGVRNSPGGEWPAGLTGFITGLTFNGKQVGYVTANLNGTFGETTLWFEPLGGHPELIDQETSGAGNVCRPEFVSPVLSGPLAVRLPACLRPVGPTPTSIASRATAAEKSSGRATRSSTRATKGITSIVPDGAGVDWDSYGTSRLATRHVAQDRGAGRPDLLQSIRSVLLRMSGQGVSVGPVRYSPLATLDPESLRELGWLGLQPDLRKRRP